MARSEDARTLAIAEEQCAFCSIARSEEEQSVAYRDEFTVAFISSHQNPTNPGRSIVIPAPHIENIYEVPFDVGARLMQTLANVARGVKVGWSADGVNIRQNNERAAGQSIFHLHFHVIPRFIGDTGGRGGLVALAPEERAAQASRLREYMAR